MLGCTAAADTEQCRRDILEGAYTVTGLAGVLHDLEDFFVNDWDGEGGSVLCHNVYHDLGVVAGRNLGDEALVAGVSMCEGGYYHGVLIGTPTLSPTACSELPYEDAFNCWHGAGHAAFTTQREPAPSKRPCPVEQNPDFVAICQQGYYMEYALSTGWDVESLWFCLQAETVTNCLQPLVGATVTTHPERVEEVLDVCASLSDEVTARTCWRAAAFGIHDSAEDLPNGATPTRCATNKYCTAGLAEAKQRTFKN